MFYGLSQPERLRYFAGIVMPDIPKNCGGTRRKLVQSVFMTVTNRQAAQKTKPYSVHISESTKKR